MVAVTLFYALAALQFLPSFKADHIHLKRHHHPKRAIPANWASRGCFTDVTLSRTLQGAYFLNGATNTVDACVNKCNAAGFFYAGLEFGTQCFCGNSLDNSGVPAPLPDCSFNCPGNAAQKCGAGSRISLYSKIGNPPTPPAPGVGAWQYKGCWSDLTTARTLGVQKTVVGGMTVQKCTAACTAAGFALAGVEFAGECWCSNAFANNPTQKPDSECNMACSGNGAQMCGGPDRLNVYSFVTPPPPQWKSLGCVSDVVATRTLSNLVPVPGGVTTGGCQTACLNAGFPIAGTEWSKECYCDTQFRNAGVTSAATDCNMPCQGDANSICGGPVRLNAYYWTGGGVVSQPTVQTANLPANWVYQYCLAEPNNGRVFPYQISNPTSNTVNGCLTRCEQYGYPAAGLQWGQECWCGDISDVANNGGTQAPDSDCNMVCSGDPNHICGAGLRNTYYKRTVPLYVWNTPANRGKYEFFVPGLVVPLMAAVGINNKVVFLEKAGSGAPNSTGAYELDPSLVGGATWTDAWRTMHVKTDIFCSAGIMLPDKAGRLVNLAGWSNSAEYGVRLYTPSGSPGVAGTTDWEEDVNSIKLQKPRWYPSAMLLANGSIVVVGGEAYNSGPVQPNLEVLPRALGGDTTVALPFLSRTAPNNLYPFLHVLPSQNVLIVYYNEAVILDKDKFQTIATLPKIPGAVNNDAAGRTYPFSGTAMFLPQHAPYSDPIELLICGGAAPTKIALDNCVHIAPEVPGAQWVIERMPSKRVLVCMANLPDGTYFIGNGAKFGAGGFANANTPNFTPVLYDPSLPVNQRMTALSSTNIARMYHSEAVTMPDGSVLISGSDPLDPNFPEEYRVEHYLPPYLTSGLPRPAFTIQVKDWAYNGFYDITVTAGSMTNFRVSLIAGTMNTHGNTMMARTLFPEFTCIGTACKIQAPPNRGVCPPGWFMLFVLDGPTPSISKWVRIGGDPSKLGNWPPGNAFTRPGV